MTSVGRPERYSDDECACLSRLKIELQNAPTELIPIGSLIASDSPRVAGTDQGHVNLLAQAEVVLPPIVVHRKTMNVVDGVHRLRAAQLRGARNIEARFIDGDEDDVFLFSVSTNVDHGLPLTMADRVAAAERIFASHPQWSDRAVASVVGLSSGKVSDIRDGLASELPQFTSRIGRDGRDRPLNGVVGRERACAHIRANPTASVRQIARAAGISPATAADVRNRLRRGDDPIPRKQRKAGRSDDGPRPVIHRNGGNGGGCSVAELSSLFDTLRRDPSMRFNEMGRMILRGFEYCAFVGRQRPAIAEAVPSHCRTVIAELFIGYSDTWRSVGEELRGGGHVPA